MKAIPSAAGRTFPTPSGTTYAYDPLGDLLSVTQPGGGETVDAYDADGDQTSTVNPDGDQTVTT
ncbi:MAG: hypothetical protein ACRENX_09010 [Candidatus Dormibacteria bacterium]